MAEDKQSITINGITYDFNALSEQARAQIVSLRVTDQEIERLQRQLAIYQTARAAYASALQSELPKAEH